MRARDDIDEKLIALLGENSRQPLKSLAAAVSLSTSSVQERVTRLERDGVIAGFTIKLGDDASHRAYMLVTTSAQSCAELAPKISHIDEIRQCDSVAGEIDMVLVVETRVASRVQDIRDEIAALPGVEAVVTLNRLVTRFSR